MEAFKQDAFERYTFQQYIDSRINQCRWHLNKIEDKDSWEYKKNEIVLYEMQYLKSIIGRKN